MTKKIITGTLIASVLGVMLYLLFPKDFQGTPSSDLTEVPDIYLDGVKIQTFNALGELAYELRADEIEQFSAQDTMYFTGLQIRVERAGGQLWHMTAQQGAIRPDPDHPSQILEPIQLRGAVNVYSGEAENPEYAFQGADVTYDPSANTVYSTATVFVKTEDSTYDAAGFHFDMTTKELQLSSSPDNQVEIRIESDRTE